MCLRTGEQSVQQHDYSCCSTEFQDLILCLFTAILVGDLQCPYITNVCTKGNDSMQATTTDQADSLDHRLSDVPSLKLRSMLQAELQVSAAIAP